MLLNVNFTARARIANVFSRRARAHTKINESPEAGRRAAYDESVLNESISPALLSVCLGRHVSHKSDCFLAYIIVMATFDNEFNGGE